MRQTSGCIAITVLPFDVAAVGVASIFMGEVSWLSVIVGMVAGSLLWLLFVFLSFKGTGDETRDG